MVTADLHLAGLATIGVIDHADGEPEDASPVTWSDHFIFVKVGEDRDDINTSGFGPWPIYPETSIHIGY